MHPCSLLSYTYKNYYLIFPFPTSEILIPLQITININLMRRLIFILVMSFISLNSFATSQVPDYIIYKGDTLCLLTNPLESYFKVHNLKFRDLSSVGNFSTAC